MAILNTSEALRQVTIYGLFDPRDGRLRYVGKTVQAPSHRLSEHICHRIRQRTKCSSWIKSLQKSGFNPQLKTLALTDEANWRQAERHWIALSKEEGADLCNLAEGGNGRSGYGLSSEHKEKIRLATLGRKFSDESKLKLRNAKLGKPRPDVAFRNSQNSKLLIDHVREIKKSKAKGCDLAIQFGVSKALVSLIRNGKRRACELFVSSGELP